MIVLLLISLFLVDVALNCHVAVNIAYNVHSHCIAIDTVYCDRYLSLRALQFVELNFGVLDHLSHWTTVIVQVFAAFQSIFFSHTHTSYWTRVSYRILK